MSTLERDDYVIGTHEPEVARLGLQHRVWRPHMRAAWALAGVGAGHRIADLGAGPGYATLDLAAVVGPTGHVDALERSQKFLAVLRAAVSERGLRQVSVVEADLEAAALPLERLDATWCRWVLSFLREPEALVARIAAALRPGGTAIFHEYLDYRAWRGAPAFPALERFVVAVVASWRAHGGEADVGLKLPAMLARAGLRIVHAAPMSFFAAPGEPMWEWTAAFLTGGAARLVDIGLLSAAENEALQSGFAEFSRQPESRMLTPTVLELIAVKA